MCAEIAVRKIATAGRYFANLCQIPGAYPDFRSSRIAIAFCADELEVGEVIIRPS